MKTLHDAIFSPWMPLDPVSVLLRRKFRGGGGASGAYYTLTGTLPLTLPHSLAAAIRSLTRTGSMTQSPAPTPDAPVYPSINNGTVAMVHRSGLPSGYKLLKYVGSSGVAYVVTDVFLASTDVVEAEFRNNSTTGYGSLYGVFRLGDSSALYANQTYYGYDENNNKVDTNLRVDTAWHTSRHDFVNGTLTIDDTTVDFVPWEFANTTQNAVLARYYNNSYGYIWKGYIRKFKVTRGGEVICDLLPAKNEQDEAGLYDLVSGNFYTATSGTLVAGDEVNDYEPAVVGDTEVLTVGHDLVVGATYGGFIRAGNPTAEKPKGSVQLTSGWCHTGFIPVQPETAYRTVTQAYEPATGAGLCYYEDDTEESCLGGVTCQRQGGEVFEFETPENCHYVRFSWKSRDTNDGQMYLLSEIQTASVPDLFAVDNYRDEVDIISGSVTRRVKRYVFDGTENWTQPGGADYFRLDGMFTDAISYSSDNPAIVCTHFVGRQSKVSASNMADGEIKLGYTSTYNRLYLKYAAMADVAALNAFFAEQIEAGTPVVMWYAVEEPVIESVTPQALRTQDGTTVVSSSAGSAGASVEYKASEDPSAANAPAAEPTNAPTEEGV